MVTTRSGKASAAAAAPKKSKTKKSKAPSKRKVVSSACRNYGKMLRQCQKGSGLRSYGKARYTKSLLPGFNTPSVLQRRIVTKGRGRRMKGRGRLWPPFNIHIK